MGKIKFYWANGCMNCKGIKPILEQVKAEYPSIEIEAINTEDAKKDIAAYEIASLPTLVFLKSDVIVGKLVGLKPKSLIIKKIQEVF